MRRIVYSKSASKNSVVVSPERGWPGMTTMEVLTLLLLIATVVFGILGYIKK